MDQAKEGLRQQYRKARVEFTKSCECLEAENSKLSELVVDLISSWKLPAGSTLASYCATGSEADPLFIGRELKQFRWAYPIINGDDLEFYVPNSDQAFEMGQHNIRQPKKDESIEVDAADCSAILIPGVAFDRQGGRLGQGKAYYDRTLRRSKAKKIGIGFTAQVHNEALPSESHDVPVDYIVTEKFILQPWKGK